MEVINMKSDIISGLDVEDMTREELVTVYKELRKIRGEGGDAKNNIQKFLDTVMVYAQQSEYFELPKVPEDNTISGYIKQTDTPESSSLSGYGYDYYTQTLYIKYRNTGKVYAYYDVPVPRYEAFEASESKGSDAAKIKKEFGIKK
jgi:hypothetical protein